MDANSSNTWSILAILHDASLKISSLSATPGRLPTQNSTSHHYEYATNCSRPTKGLTCRLHFAALPAWTTPTIHSRPIQAFTTKARYSPACTCRYSTKPSTSQSHKHTQTDNKNKSKLTQCTQWDPNLAALHRSNTRRKAHLFEIWIRSAQQSIFI